MPERIQLVLSRAEKERYRRVAARHGLSLGEWLRAAAEAKLAADEGAAAGTLRTVEGLDEFFRECDERAGEREPDWAEHERVIEQSRRSGRSGT